MRTILPPLRWRPTPNVSSRHGQPVSLIVVHAPAGSYEGSVDWLCNPKAQASAHGVLGRPARAGGPKLKPLEFTQLVRWSQKSWSCVNFNAISEGLEISDDAWNGRDPEALRVAARIVAFRLHKRGLPARWARGGGGYGFCRHADLGMMGGGHTQCPTTNLVLWGKFVLMVKYELRRGNFRKSWGME